MNILNKKHIFIGLFAVIIVSTIVLFLMIGGGGNEEPILRSDISVKQADWSAVTPSADIKSKAEDKLLEEISRVVVSQGVSIQYKSKSKGRNHEVVYDIDGKVIFFNEKVVYDGDESDDSVLQVTGEFGEADYQLYGSESASGNFLFAYPAQGIAYYGNPFTESLTEIWYFEPTTLSDLTSSWARLFSEEQPISPF